MYVILISRREWFYSCSDSDSGGDCCASVGCGGGGGHLNIVICVSIIYIMLWEIAIFAAV